MDNTNRPSGWRYQVVRFANRAEFDANGLIYLNQLGTEGWEVCGFTNDAEEGGYLTVLKQST